MNIKQFENPHLSHFSYAVWSGGEMMIIDPGRNIIDYLELAETENCRITAIAETHTHADFVSGHLQLSTYAEGTIYCSEFYDASFPHHPVSDGYSLKLGSLELLYKYSPGHSDDSMSIIVYENDKPLAVFSGDTLLIGDCGRPDLRNREGVQSEKAEELATKMYSSLRDIYISLPDEVQLFPAHGAGSLCGKAISSANSSTMGQEKKANWCLQEFKCEDFVEELIADQPFIPKYFEQCVQFNRKGAPDPYESLEELPHYTTPDKLNPDLWIIDVRDEKSYKKAHLPGSINLQKGKKMETWLGSIIRPAEKFYLQSNSSEDIPEIYSRIADIGYESHLAGILIYDEGSLQSAAISAETVRNGKEKFTIVDVRNPEERKEKEIFTDSIHIPLYELRERSSEIPPGQAVVVHCSAGYRSAAAGSILEKKLENTTIYDLGSEVEKLK